MKEYTWGEGDAAWFALIYDGVSEPKVSFGVDHDAYRAEVTLPAPLLASLKADFEG